MRISDWSSDVFSSDLPGVIGDALVLDLLDRVPFPQRAPFGLAARVHRRDFQHDRGEHRGIMFERDRRHQVDDRRALPDNLPPRYTRSPSLWARGGQYV